MALGRALDRQSALSATRGRGTHWSSAAWSHLYAGLKLVYSTLKESTGLVCAAVQVKTGLGGLFLKLGARGYCVRYACTRTAPRACTGLTRTIGWTTRMHHGSAQSHLFFSITARKPTNTWRISIA